MDLINIFLIIIGITNLFLALIIYFNAKKIEKINLNFTFIAINVAFWSLAMAFFRETTQPETALLALKILYVVPIFIPIIFLYFIYLFLKENLKILNEKTMVILLTLWSLLLAGTTFFSDKIISGGGIPPVGEKLIYFGDLYILYVIHFIVFFGAAFLMLMVSYFKEKNKTAKGQITFLYLGTFISSSIGMLTNLILPWFGYFTLNWLGNIMTIFLVGFILYAILKYKLFETKIIAIEIFILFILITLFIDLFFVRTTSELIIKNLILISVVVMSFIIIKGVYKEIQTREKIEKLADDLKEANIQLKKMNKQKSEFINLASHQLRGPVASLKGYSSMILEGSYGPVSKKVEDVVERLFQSSKNLAFIIDDFLNLSRIERGKIEFNFEKTNIKNIVKQSVEELKQKAGEKKLKLSFKAGKGDYIANVDSEKMRQIISNLIDNSIKYTPKGSVSVNIDRKEDNIIIKVSDTGIGIPKGEMNKLFKKFSRLENANDENIQGTGLGLYLAKEVVTAHKGKIWVESGGENKGSTFFVELNGK